MPATKKAKIKIKELKPKVKIIESKEQAESGESEKPEETQLEDIIIEAPSAGEFPALRVQPGESQERPPAMTTPSATTEAEASAGAKYEIQKNISEAEIRRVYQSRTSEPRRAGAVMPLSVPEIRDTKTMLQNREVEALRSEREEDKYSIEPEVKSSSVKRKFPWEA